MSEGWKSPSGKMLSTLPACAVHADRNQGYLIEGATVSGVRASIGNVIELTKRAFLFEVKPEGLTEYSSGDSPGIRI